jgi:hypothetical protein
MERSASWALVACLTCSLCFCATVARANLIQNGDFALPAVGENDSPPYTMPDSWTTTVVGLPNPADGITRNDTPEFDKCMYFGIDETSPGGTGLGGTTLTLSQPVSLDPGTYRLAFNFTFYTFGGTGEYYESDEFRIVLPGGTTTVVTNHNEPTLGGFGVDFVDTPRHVTFTLNDPAADFDLGFQLYRDRDMPGVATVVALDNVDLSPAAVPTPAAAVLGVFGLSFAGWRLGRRTP